VGKEQTHELTRDSLTAALDYFAHDAPPDPEAWLLRKSRKGGKLNKPGLTIKNINARVATLGKSMGVWDLSPHDLRHYWATAAAQNKTSIDRL
jgi:integrase